MSRHRSLHSMFIAVGACALLVAGAASAQAQQYGQAPPASDAAADQAQAPGRVARLAYLSGDVQFAPAGESDWGSVEINRPMVIGDRLLTGDDGLAVLELGDAAVRIDNDSAFDFLNLDESNVQIELSQGTLNLAVRQMGNGENFEVDTPTVAFVASAPGVYRIDDGPSGTGTMVTVFSGSGTVYGENGVSRQVVEGTSYRFNDSALASVDVTGLPPPDDFDRFCDARDANYARSVQQQQQYVPPDMIGADDLDQYGEWNPAPEYGYVWYPNAVPVGWAPYRYGHWAWIDPWGWTWVGGEPWGFAPFHYGRWIYIRDRWGWVPGPVNVQPAYAPALVAFVGGSGFSVSIGIGGGPVGWFPLGPRDVYVPWFHASRRYFTNVNVTNIRNVYVNQTVINNYYSDYRAGRVPAPGRDRYAYRDMPGAVTAVARDVFTGARPVQRAALKLDRAQLARAEVSMRPAVNPGMASLGVRGASARPAVLKGRTPFARPVVARLQPPPRPAGFAEREKIIASQHGQPLTATQMRGLVRSHPVAEARTERVRLVPPIPRAAPVRPGPIGPTVRRRPAAPVAAPRPADQSERPLVRPIPERNLPTREVPLRPGALPSARFAHPPEPARLPRAPVVRPAGEPQRPVPRPSGRLPAVTPIERAPQSAYDRAAQQRQSAAEMQQRVSVEQAQQQRARDQRVQQRLQSAQQSERAQEMRAEQQQLQQQRDVQMRQQRAVEAQREQQVRERPAPRTAHPPSRAAPERRPPPHRPPPSSGDRRR